ncbi:calcium-binding protein, partial [Pseudosulfitobacter sp. DSM 107133]
MINIKFFGNTFDILEDTFGDIDVTSFNSTSIVVRDNTSGFVTTINGTNFVQDASAESGFRGTVTGFSTVTGTGAQVATVTGLSVEADTFDAAIAAGAEGNNALLSALFSTDNVTVDATMSNIGIDLDRFFQGVTSNITITGSSFEDRLEGAAGNDTIIVANQPVEGDLVIGSGGNDTIDFRGIGAEPWSEIAYFRSNAIAATINGAANTGQVVKSGQGTDTFLGVRNVLTNEGGLTLQGSDQADSFVVDGGANSWMQLTARGGNDTFDITLSGDVRLAFDFGGGGLATQGAVVNLATGTVSNDGTGGIDQISLTDGPGRLEIRGTYFNDNITGSARNERFILLGGNDTLDAGGGIDQLRYDRSRIDGGVTVDLAAGTATGVWNGQAFNHSISGIEEVRGTRDGDDRITGSMGDDTLRGYGGDDSLFGGNGNDFLSGGSGNDYLNPGDNTNFDEVNAHSGNDTVDLGDIVNGYVDVQHYDLAYAAGQVIMLDGRANTGSINKGVNGTTTILDIQNAMQADGLGVLASNLNDTINVTVAEDGFVQVAGGRGNDSFVLDSLGGLIRIDLRSDAQYQHATQGAVVDLGTGIISNDGFGFQDTINRTSTGRIEVRGTDFADSLLGGGLRDSFIGRGGNDTIDGGDGIDRVRYDRGGMTSGVKVDLEKGVATGMWEGAAFTHTLSNIEQVRGSNFGDSLAGTLGAEEFDIKSGDDFVYGDGIQANLTGDIAGQVYR